MLLVLRRRFLLASMGALLAVLVLLCAAFNVTNYWKLERRLDATLQKISANDGKMPRPKTSSAPKPESKAAVEAGYSTRYFVVTDDDTLKVKTFNLDNIATVTDEEAQACLQEALGSGRDTGYCGENRAYKFLVTKTGSGTTRVIFLYCFPELESYRATMEISALVSAGSYLAVFLLVFLLSGRIVKPFLVSMERQKQFITDASHEIKTPLGVLAANNDVLAMEYGENDWTRSSRGQIARLSGLVTGMITLTRLDEEHPLPPAAPFDAAAALRDMLDDFEAPARMADKRIERRLESPLPCLGDEAAFRQLAVILLDNAVKYAPAGSAIDVRLSRRRKKPLLEITNACEPMDRDTLGRLFDRFYRQDASRAGGGSGIGLSIARRLAENHRWRLTASIPEPGLLRFTAEL